MQHFLSSPQHVPTEHGILFKVYDITLEGRWTQITDLSIENRRSTYPLSKLVQTLGYLIPLPSEADVINVVCCSDQDDFSKSVFDGPRRVYVPQTDVSHTTTLYSISAEIVQFNWTISLTSITAIEAGDVNLDPTGSSDGVRHSLMTWYTSCSAWKSYWRNTYLAPRAPLAAMPRRYEVEGLRT